MDEIDIWRTAKILIDAHGDNAWLEAARRADHCLEDGNPEGINVWKRVLRSCRGFAAAKASVSRERQLKMGRPCDRPTITYLRRLYGD
jgi:hypothetical protein